MTSGSARAQWIAVSLMFAFSVMSYFDRTIMSIAGPVIMNEFGLTATQIGAVYSSFLLAYALFMVPGGRLADRFGPRKALAVTGLGSAIFTALTAVGAKPGLGTWTGVLPALIGIRFLMGVCTAPLYPACGRMCADWIAPDALGRVQGFIIGGASLGGAVAPMLFRVLMGRFGWRESFFVAALATAGLALVWWISVTDRPNAAAQQESTETVSFGAASRLLFRNRNLLLVTAAYAASSYFAYIFYYWIYYYFGDARHFGYEQSARFTTLVFIVSGLMMPLGGWLSDRLARGYGENFGRRAVPICGFLLSAALLVAGTMTSGPWITVLLVALSMGCAVSCEGPFWAMTIRLGGDQSGLACSILNMGSNVTGLFAPVLTPYISARLGWSWGLYFGCLVILLGALACWRVRLRSDYRRF